MRTIIAGSRGSTRASLRAALRRCDWITEITSVISGTCRGTDQHGEEWAKSVARPVARFPADWDKHGKSAGYIRNKLMAENADALIAVWDGTSRGTKHMIDLAEAKGLRVLVYRTDLQTATRQPGQRRLVG